MAEPWLIYVLIFAFSVVAAHQLQAGLAGALRGRKSVRRRLFDLGGPSQAAELDTLRRRSTGQFVLTAQWNRLLLQSGTQASSAALGMRGLGIALVFLVLLPVPGVWLRLCASLLASGLLVLLYLRIKRARRLARFGEQLPEVLDVIVRSLRAGHPLPVSLSLVARETPEPAGPEFALVVDEMNYGRSISEALEGLHQRVGHPELAFVVAAISIANQTGGNLGEILSRLSRMLRDRFRLTRRVRALTAEGRFSGYALSVMPVALFVLINLVSAAYYAEFWASPVSGTVTGIAVGLLVLGNLVIYRLVNFKV
ncbi:type II secretion system F family protein [uncultured Methylobacterium sp.]|uniref:type II secretion system F family protein n=1 Tax=uncultured Methylobacterium sp. TaxID=157278 RepID=UPI0035CBDE17